MAFKGQEEDIPEVVRKIREVMRIKKVSVEEASRLIGISRSSLTAKLKSGRLTVMELEDLAEICGVYIGVSIA